MWGVTFKPKTDDIREAPALTIIESLLKAGARYRLPNPQGLDNLRRSSATESGISRTRTRPWRGATGWSW